MILSEIINHCRIFSIHEERIVDDDYLELVLFTKEIDKWFKILSCILGPPVKPAGVEPSEENLRVTETSGGIWVHQTLFEKAFYDSVVIAKFWPWQDGIHTTLKVAKLIKIDYPRLKNLPCSTPLASGGSLAYEKNYPKFM